MERIIFIATLMFGHLMADVYAQDNCFSSFFDWPITDTTGLNDCVDWFVGELPRSAVELGLPDAVNNFEWKILSTTYSGQINLNNGWVNALGPVTRAGNVTIIYEYPNLKLQLPLKLDSLLFNYNYEAKFMGLGPRGEVSGTVKNILILTDILIALNSTSIGKINIVDNGKVSLKFKGNILTDWLANVFVAVTRPFLTPISRELVADLQTIL